MMVPEALKNHVTFNNLDKQDSDSAGNNLSTAAKRCQVDNNQKHMEWEVAQYIVDKSDLDYVIIHLMNHFPDHISQLAIILNASCELQERVMMDLKQAYQESTQNEVAIQIMQMNARKVLFQYGELHEMAVNNIVLMKYL